ncbi:MAG: DUF2306 domain-containing protein [Elusimicrobia bacterium]|nr:DUF2306 domain-containing protein [Elusimicrobiota bacterium]
MRKFIQTGAVFLTVVGLTSVLGHLFHFKPPEGALWPPGPDWYNSQLDRYRAHPFFSYTHILLGGFFLLFAPIQFFPFVRAKALYLHRFLGRLLVAGGLLIGLSGLGLGTLIPFGGTSETIVAVVASFLFLLSLSKAFYYIRAKKIGLHRKWMIRAYALGLGVALMRVFDSLLFPFQIVRDQDLFWITLILGWGLSLSVAELWIRRVPIKT